MRRSRTSKVVPAGANLLADDAPSNNDEDPTQEPDKPEAVPSMEEEQDDLEDSDEPILKVPFLEEDEPEEDDPKNRPYTEVANSVFDLRHLRAGRIIQSNRDVPHPGMIVTDELHQITHPDGCTLLYRRVLIPESDVLVHPECQRMHRVYGNLGDETIFEILGDRNPYREQLKEKAIKDLINSMENYTMPLIPEGPEKEKMKVQLEALKKN